MSLIANVVVALVALLHFYFLLILKQGFNMCNSLIEIKQVRFGGIDTNGNHNFIEKG